MAGTYENEVLAVSVLVRALRQMQRRVSPHNRIEVDLHTASGGFALSFFDGEWLEGPAATGRAPGGEPHASTKGVVVQA